jgi:hypothetical protein
VAGVSPLLNYIVAGTFITEKNGFIVEMSIFACIARKPVDRCGEDLFEIEECLQP